jgi:exonuclease III
MKIITWNVKSVHARLPRVTALLARHQPDVACLQEIKPTSGQGKRSGHAPLIVTLALDG